MLETVRLDVVSLATHYVGNFGLNEELVLTDKPFVFENDNIKDVFFFKYLMGGFKSDIFYHFVNKSEFALYDVKDAVEKIFNSKNNTEFMDATKSIATHLYKQTMHPKIKGGELYIAYMKDIMVNGELCNAVGIFKSESKDTYLKVDVDDDARKFCIETEVGINPKKLDKGVLIFNVDKGNGYKAVMVDNSKKISDASHYWFKDFLDMELKHSPYLTTSNYINQCVAFCGEVLTEDNKFDKKDRMAILNESVGYFDRNIEFVQDDFISEVLKNDENLVELFVAHKEQYNKTYAIEPIDNFEISKTAVKQNSAFLKSIIELDNNFKINILGGHDWIEEGYDKEKEMKFYKIYYNEEK